MNLLLLAPAWTVLIFVGLLLLAALQDMMLLKVSNSLSGALVVLAGFALVLVGPQWSLWQNLVVSAAVVGICTWLFRIGVMGGGDVKLIGATLLWFDLRSSLLLLLMIAVAGGLLALLILLARAISWSQRVRERWPLLRHDEGIPYGIAVAAGAISTSLMLGPS